MGPTGTGRPGQCPGPWPPGAANPLLPQPLDSHLQASMFPHYRGHLTTHPVSDTKIHEQNGRPGKGRHGTENVRPQAAPHLHEEETGGKEQREEMRRRSEDRRQQLSPSQASHSQGAVATLTRVPDDPSPFLLGPPLALLCSLLSEAWIASPSPTEGIRAPMPSGPSTSRRPISSHFPSQTLAPVRWNHAGFPRWPDPRPPLQSHAFPSAFLHPSRSPGPRLSAASSRRASRIFLFSE